MLLPPWVPTSASATPLPLTRWSMIPRASSRFWGVTFSPLAVLAASVIRVPPCRSSPSLGFHTAPRATPTYSAPTTTAKMMSRRPGRAAFLATATRSSSAGRPAVASGVVLVGLVVPEVPGAVPGVSWISPVRAAEGTRVLRLDHAGDRLSRDLPHRARSHLDPQSLLVQRSNGAEN